MERLQDCPVSAQVLVFHPNTGYYFLFETDGKQGLDSHVYASRSRSEAGPFTDRILLLAPMELGTEFRFTSFACTAVTQPDASADRWLMHCTVTVSNAPAEQLMTFPLYFDPDGYPVVFPADIADSPIPGLHNLTEEIAVGEYDYVALTPKPIPVCEISCSLTILSRSQRGKFSMHDDWAIPLPEEARGRLELGGCMCGWWNRTSDHTVTFRYCNYQETCYGICLNDIWYLSGRSTKGIVSFAMKLTDLNPDKQNNNE